MKDLFDVEGKVALVTGGSSGIGAMMARGLLENGAKVFITARKVDRLLAMQEALSQYGECIAIPSDLSELDGIDALVASVNQAGTRLDILVNNAGANWSAPIESFPESGWDKVMDINIKSAFFSVQKFLPLLKASSQPDHPARVVNIASINGLRNSGMPTFAYSASKAGIVHLTRHLASELAPHGINVNSIAPGFFPSDMTKEIVESDKLSKIAISRIPLGRPGTQEDIAGTLIYLCSRASSWITGHTIVLDGGMIAAP